MFDAQQFATRLTGRPGRWSLLRDFVAEWHRPLTTGDGCPAEELDDAERRLGLALPVALREWYQLSGRRADITQTQNSLVSPARLALRDDVLIFYVESQDVVEWGIQTSDLALEDPPVWQGPGGEAAWRGAVRENNTLSEFALQMVLFETVMGAGDLGGSGWLEPEALPTVEQKFTHLGFPDWHWPLHPTRFYGGEDVLFWVAGEEEFWGVGRSRETFDRLIAQLKVIREE